MSATDVAIVGIAGKYSHAGSPTELWQALVAGRELNNDGPASTRKGYVGRFSEVADIEYFDHEFFGFTPFEAAVTDPQHRLLLECCYRAMEDAGYADLRPRRFGVFGSTTFSSYLINNIVPNEKYWDGSANFSVLMGNDKDTVAARVAYKLNLIGPAVTIQTACSSSLVALANACTSLLSQECDGAIVGAVSLMVPQDAGYRYDEGGILSSDGYCRTFDASSSGIIKGNGCSAVVLKRLDDAERDGDHIYAVVKATAVNNDGSRKAGFTAPSITGQASVIQECLDFADLAPEDIDYIEAHGTGTQLGDPIEIAALAQVFDQPERGLPVGSVKANVGHLDCAAGLTGVIKAVFMLGTGVVPANIHLATLNPKIDNSKGFFSFPRENGFRELRTIGVSSFGLGGTNAHAIIAGPKPANVAPRQDLPLYLLPLSSLRSGDDLEQRRLIREHLTPDLHLGDVAFTLASRRQWQERRFFVVATREDLLAVLAGVNGQGTVTGEVTLDALIDRSGVEDLRALAAVLPVYDLCVRAVRRDVPALAGDLERYQTALFLLLAHLDARDERVAAQRFAVMDRTADAIYRRGPVLADGTHRLDEACHQPDPGGAGQDATERAGALLRVLYGYLASVGRRQHLDLRCLYRGLGVRHVPLPGYPMTKSRCWIDPPRHPTGTVSGRAAPGQPLASALADLQTVAREIADLVAGALELTEVRTSDDFFQLGGDSLQAIDIVSRINARYGTAVELQEFLAASRLADAAELVCRQAAPPCGPDERQGKQPEQQLRTDGQLDARPVAGTQRSLPAFMPRIRTGDGPQVFAVHPAGGTTFCYRAMSRYLTEPCTLLGLDLPSGYARRASMRDLARFYADAVEEVQPAGTVALCGYSFGGNLAVEIGEILVADGRNVAPLLLVDSFPPEAYRQPSPSRDSYRQMLPGVARAYLPRELADQAAGVPGSADTSVGGLMAAAEALGLSQREIAEFFDMWVYNHDLLRTSGSGAFRGDALVLEADTATDTELLQGLHVAEVSRDLWRAKIGGELVLRTIPGDHFTCMGTPENLRTVAVEFARWVRSLSRTAQGPGTAGQPQAGVAP